ncbi:MAG: tyrosine-type recombinase/integrase [Rickettsiales bacterium]|nr:tyrosine-type recombinase/integrase [Rickettsiales bacterium]
MTKNNEVQKIDNSSQNFSLTTIEEISEEIVWLENFTSKATRETYKATVKKFCSMFEIQNIDQLRSVSSIHIIKFRDAMKEAGEKNSSINSRLAGLSSLFKHLIERQLIKTNPVYGVKAMKKDYRKVKSRLLSDAEIAAILKQPDTTKLVGLRDRAILSIFFNIGTRRGTIVDLKGKDIYEEGGYMVFDMHLKGDKRNQVAVNSHIQANLKKYLEAMGYYSQDGEGNIKLKIPDEIPVFPQMSNNPKLCDFSKPMSGVAVWKLWQKYAKMANLEKTRPHCARSTFITKALAATNDLNRVRQTVGHNDVRTTISYDQRETEHKNSASFVVSFD